MFRKLLSISLMVSMSATTFASDASLKLNKQQAKSSIPSQQLLNNSSPNQSLENGTYTKENRHNLLLPGETDVRNLLPSSGEDVAPPYGANLFAGGYESERSDGLNDNYLIAAGDKINIWLWGAVNYSNVVTVDNQGNIFIPEIGPINVKDKPASEINSFVTNKVKNVYTSNVEVYVNLLTATPLSIYLSGPVIRPGQYAGMASDSILYYLKRAGGIDPVRGSYREIHVIRNNHIIEKIDLYDFIQKGKISEFSFKDGDVILVKPQGAAITVSGDVRNPFRFELKTESELGDGLSSYAKPLAKVSHVGIVGNRSDGPFSHYMPLDEFKKFNLKDGDQVIYNDDLHAQVIDVEISGNYLGPSYFAVDKQTKLHDLLNYIPVNPMLADYQSIYILRKSVAEKQSEMIEQSLNRLERSVFTAPASSDGEATIRAKEAEMVMQFTDRARKIKPLGKVIVSDNGLVANILLEQGDVVVIPNKTDLIHVGGEVLMPQAIVYNKKATVDDYIAWSGGFTERAEDQRIAVVKSNGLVEFNNSNGVQKGDQILVLPKVDSKNMQAVKDMTQIIYQIAVAANVVLN